MLTCFMVSIVLMKILDIISDDFSATNVHVLLNCGSNLLFLMDDENTSASSGTITVCRVLVFHQQEELMGS